jgi:hypothetical protein
MDGRFTFLSGKKKTAGWKVLSFCNVSSGLKEKQLEYEQK